jgi:hypothetical protein
MIFQRLRYMLWDRWRYGSLINGPPGQKAKVQFQLSEEGGPSSEGLWAQRVDGDCFRLLNNALYARAAEGDIVRVRERWPVLEVVEIVERARRTWGLFFNILPTDDERRKMVEALLSRGGKPEWWQPDVLSVAVQLVDDAFDVCRDILGPGVDLVEQDGD